MDIFRYTQYRPMGLYKGNPDNLTNRFLAQQMPGLFQEKEYNLGTINKVFTSQWLSDRQVVVGTKCNKIIVLDLQTCQMSTIPSLKSSDESIEADCPCGIHSIAINPSNTLIATGADHTNDLAVYRLPTFDPVFLGECGHDDWIFDIKWLDDEFLVTGSRDSKMALWQVKDDDDGSVSKLKSLQVPEYVISKPVAVRQCRRAEKVRALAYNKRDQEIAALSLNGYIHLWDAVRFSQKNYRKLSYTRENVCMSFCNKRTLYAVGSQSHVTLIDPRTMKNSLTILSRQRGCGIRSVSFNESVVTIGTGAGAVLFYDLRTGKYLQCNCGHACMLNVGKGWLRHDDAYRDFFMDLEYPNAIYTHCYDASGTKLFTAGGPLPAGLWGNYASVWQ
ncbi:DDB1- and CUL4-associated factor 12 [Lingula anatina]|uniref:DDB1- and CUL4-associated factor 12 n=1 Tax=Lingula anatina TaxID=7574 RepID=A0A1S3GZU7_LINAN|nr:DDB1- and CUL4-associated factor 12 [Lingula anatina]XP_013378754.1 DDB1- and CUL4-associated factor 12 [Lingula anatina]XP_013378756.1 DDB1- and CUL4-associated factor 12 [Lingula anatina]XP_013378757.1 DDB1- and CUL4-associated factor 12 [Lingula anatina]XP_013378758.1 DDB1- and CUL4-associated factor 12 [Lingula anatina]XP_023933651.1 DDB1- and CUL4-associated factor 12 [Lingula anatina]|eukprot:XP_013378753.1 DDB1- and CUL4-associated factor 12 [Lingula anatina]